MANYLSKIIIDGITALIRDEAAQQMISSINSNLSSLTSKINNVSIINVKDYGATGDGVTDDTAAFVSAITAVPAHGTLYVPDGKYILSSTLIIKKPMTIIGDYFGFIIDEDNDYCDNATYSKRQIVSSASPAVSIKACGVHIANMFIESTTGEVIHGNMDDINSNTGVLRDIIIENCALRGVTVGINFDCSVIVSKFSNVWVWTAQTSFQIGKLNSASTSLLFENCWAINYTSTGYNLINVHYSSLVSCASDTTPNGNYGYILNACKNVNLIGCGAEKNGIAGAYVYNSDSILLNLECIMYNVNNADGGGMVRLGASKRVTFLNCKSNDDQTQSGKHAIYFTDTSEFTVINCNFKVLSIAGTLFNVGDNYSYRKAPEYTATNCTVSFLNFKMTNDGLIVSGAATVTGTGANIVLTGYVGCTELVYGLTSDSNMRVYKRNSRIYFEGTSTSAFNFTVNFG